MSVLFDIVNGPRKVDLIPGYSRVRPFLIICTSVSLAADDLTALGHLMTMVVPFSKNSTAHAYLTCPSVQTANQYDAVYL